MQQLCQSQQLFGRHRCPPSAWRQQESASPVEARRRASLRSCRVGHMRLVTMCSSAITPSNPEGSQPIKLAPPPSAAQPAGNGVFLLLLLNVALFVADKVVHLPAIKALYLHHMNPHWWQFLTHQFCHGSLSHLSSNLFYVLIFGRLIEETEGGVGVWFVYLITGLGAAVASYCTSMHQPIVSVGASGAVFGLFVVSVLMRLQRFNIKNLLEAGILGNMVVRQVLEEVRQQVGGGAVIGGMRVSHIAHLGGALAGVLLVVLLSRLPAPPAGTA